MSNTDFDKIIKSLIDFGDNVSSTLKRVIEYNKGNTQDESISKLAKKIKPYIGEVEDLVIAAKDIINTYSKPIDKDNVDSALSVILKDIFSDRNIENFIEDLKDVKNQKISEGRKLNRQDINKYLAVTFNKIPSIETTLKKFADSSMNIDTKSVITKMPKSTEFHKTTPKHAREHIGGSNNPNSSDVKTSKAALKAIENAAKKNGGRIVRGYGKDKNKLYFVPNEEKVKKTKSGTEYIDKKSAEKFIEIEYMPVKNGGFIHNGNEKSAGQVPYIDSNGEVRGVPLPQMYLNQIADNADNIFKEFKSDPGLAQWRAKNIKDESLSIASVRNTNKAEIDKETFGTNSEVQKLFKDNNLYLKHFIDQLFDRSEKLKSESYKEHGWTGERIRTQIVRAIYIKALNISDKLKSELFKTSDMADLVYSGAWDEVEPMLDKLVKNFKPEFGPNSEDAISHQVIGMISNDEAFFGAELTPLLRKVIQTAKVAKKANDPVGGVKNTLKGSSSALDQEDNQHQRHAVYSTDDEVINIAHKNLLKKTKEKIDAISKRIETLKNKKFKGKNSKEQEKLNKKEIDKLKIDLKKQESLLRSLGTNAPSVDDDMSLIVDDEINRNDFESYVNKTVDISNSVIDERLRIKEENISDTNAEIEVLEKKLKEAESLHMTMMKDGSYSDEEEEKKAKNNISNIKKTIKNKKKDVEKWTSAITDEHGNESLSKKRDEIIKDILEDEYGHLYQREKSEDVYSQRNNGSGMTSVLFRHASGVDKNRKYGIGNRRTQVMPIARELAEEIIRVQYGLPSDFDLSSYEMSAFVGDNNIGYNDLANSINEQLANVIKLYQDKFGINRDSKGWEKGFIDWVKNSDSPGAKQLASLLKIDKTGGFKSSSKMKTASVNVIKQAFEALVGPSGLATKLVENENERFLRDTKYTTMNVIEENPIDTTENAKVNRQIRESVLNMGGVTGMSEYALDLARAMMPTEETLGEYNQAVDAIDEAFKMSFASGKDMDKTIDPNTGKDTAISIGPGPQYDINLLDVVKELNESGSIYDEDGRVRDVEAIEKLLWSKVEKIKKEAGNEHKKFAYLDVSNADVSASDYNNNNYDINRVYLPDVKLKQNDDGTFVLPQGSPELRALMGAIVDFANIGPKDVSSKSRITRSVGNFFASQENAKNRGFYYELGNKNTVAGSQRMHGRAVNISELANFKGLRSNINKVGYQTNRKTFLENLRKKISEFGNNAAKIEYMQNFLQELTFGEDELKVGNTGTDDEAVELFENRIADYITLGSERFNKLQSWAKDRGISADSVERIRGMPAHHLRWPPTNGLDFRGMQWFINDEANLADDEFFGAFVQRLASNQDFDSDTISAVIDPLTFNNPDDAREFSNKQMEIWLRAAPRLIEDKIKEIEEVRENKANGKDILDDAFSLVENKDLYGLSDLYAKHFKEAVGQTSNMAYGIGKIIESAGLGTIGIDDTYESQLKAANAMITRNMLEALEQRMISAKHATKLAVEQDAKNRGLSDEEAEEEANKKIAELFSAADEAFNTVKRTGDIGKLYSRMQELGIIGENDKQVLDSRIGAITMSAIQGFSHGDDVLKTILGDQYSDIINNPEKYGTFTGDVVGRAVLSTQNAINQSPHNVANYNQVRYNRTGTPSEKDGFGTMMALAAHYGPRVAENTEKVNDLSEATKKLEDAIYSEAEAEKYKTSIAQKEGDQYDSNIGKLKKLKDATSQLNKANEIAKDVAKGENVYNPSVTTMIRKAFGGNEFPDLSGFRSSRDLTTNKYGGNELIDVYGEDLYKKYSDLDQSIIFGNITHGVKEAIGSAQKLGFTGSSYKDMVDWVNANRSNNTEIQKLWDEFNKEEDPETHERGIFDLMKKSEEEIMKMSLDTDDFNKRKNSAILNAVIAGETLYNASSARARDDGFVESEVKLAGVLNHAQHGRADTIVGSFGGKRWDSDLQKFIDDEDVSNIEVQDIKTDTKTGLTAKQAIQPVLYAYYLQQARELMLDKDGNIKEAFRKKDSNGGFLTGKNGEFLIDTELFKNSPSNPLSRIGMDIDDKLIDQLSKKNVEITAAIQKFNSNTGTFETHRASLRDLLGNKKIVEMISQVTNSGNFDTDIIDPENYHFLTDAFSASSIAGESGYAKDFVSSGEIKQQEEKKYVDLLKEELKLKKELSDWEAEHESVKNENIDAYNLVKQEKLAKISEAEKATELAANKAKLDPNNNDLRRSVEASIELGKIDEEAKLKEKTKKEIIDDLGKKYRNLLQRETNISIEIERLKTEQLKSSSIEEFNAIQAQIDERENFLKNISKDRSKIQGKYTRALGSKATDYEKEFIDERNKELAVAKLDEQTKRAKNGSPVDADSKKQELADKAALETSTAEEQNKKKYVDLLKQEYKLRLEIVKLKNAQAFVDKDSKEYKYYQDQIDDLNRQVKIAEKETKNAEKLVTGNGSRKLKNSLRQSYEGQLSLATLSDEEIQKKKEESAVKALNDALKEEYELKLKIAELKAKKELSTDEKEKENIDKIISLENSNLKKAEEARKAAYDKVTDKDYKNNVLSAEDAKYQLELQKLAEKLTKGTDGIAGKKSLFGDFGKQFKGYIVNMFSAYRIISKITQELRKCVQIAKELDKAATDIRIVTGMSSEEVDLLMRKYTGLARELGATTQIVAQSGQEWMRQGYSAEQANDLIVSSTKLSKLGMMDMNNATKVLTSTMKGFKLEASDVGQVVDKLTKLDMNYATTAADIGEAMSRTAAIANQMGVSLDETAAMVTTIMDITQQSAEMTGTAIRTILSRYGNVKAGSFVSMMTDGEDLDKINDIEKVLSVLGIEIRKSGLEMRDVGDVLDQLALKWTTLSDVEKNAVATAFAGTRQRNQFVVLMDNWKQVEEATDMAANAAGTADDKYGAYMDSIEARLNKLQTAWEEFTQKLSTSSFVKGAVSVLTFLVEHLDKILTLLGSISAYLMAKKLWANVGKLGGIFNGLSTIGFKKGAADAAANPNGGIINRIFGTTQKGFTTVSSKLDQIMAIMNGKQTGDAAMSIVDSMPASKRYDLYKKNQATITANEDKIKTLRNKIKTAEDNIDKQKYPNSIFEPTDERVIKTSQASIDNKIAVNNSLKAENTALKGKGFDVGNGKIITMRKGSDGNIMYYATTMKGDTPITEEIDSNSADAQNALAQKKARTKQKLVGAGAMGLASGVMAYMSGTNSYFGNMIGGENIKINDIKSDTKDNIVNGVATGAATGFLSAIPGIGPILGPMLGPVLGDLLGSWWKQWNHRDEIARKERVEEAKKNLEALNKLQSTIESAENSIFDMSTPENVSKAKNDVDAIIDALLESDNREKILSRLNKTVEEIESTLLTGTEEEKREVLSVINSENNSASAIETFRAQEQDRYDAYKKYNDLASKEITIFDNDAYKNMLEETGYYNDMVAHTTDSSTTYYTTSLSGNTSADKAKNASEAIKELNKKANSDDITKAEKEFLDGEIKRLQGIVNAHNDYQAEILKMNKEVNKLEIKSAFSKSGFDKWTSLDVSSASIEEVVQTFANNLELTGAAVRDSAGEITDYARLQIETFLRSNERFSSLFSSSGKTLNQIMSGLNKQSELLKETGARTFEELKNAFDTQNKDSISKYVDNFRNSFKDSTGKFTKTVEEATDELMRLVYKYDDSQIEGIARALNMTTEDLLAMRKLLGNVKLSDLILSPEETRSSFNELNNIFSELSTSGAVTGENLEKLNTKYFSLYNNYDENGDVISTSFNNVLENLRKRLFGDQNTVGTQGFLYQNATFQTLKEDSGLYDSFYYQVKNNNLLYNKFDENQKKLLESANSLTDIMHLFNDETFGGEMQNTLIEILNDMKMNNNYYKEIQDKLIEWQKHENDTVIDNLKSQIDALNDVNKEREKEIALIKAKEALENAQKEKVRVYRAGVGWTYETNQQKVSDAKEDLEKLERENNAENLQYQIDLLEQQNSMLDNISKNEELKGLKNSVDSYVSYMRNTFGKDIGSNITSLLDNSNYIMKWDEYVQMMGKQAKASVLDEQSNILKNVDKIKKIDAEMAAEKNKNSSKYIGLQEERNKAVESIQESKQKLSNWDVGSDDLKNYLTSEGVDERYSNIYDGGVYSAQTLNEQYYTMPERNKEGETLKDENGKNKEITLKATELYSNDEISKALQALESGDDGLTVVPLLKNGQWGNRITNTRQLDNLENGSIVHFGADKSSKKNDVNAYAIKDGISWRKLTPLENGTLGLNSDILALINEVGTEGIVTPQGTITALPSKTGIVPADLTENLYKLGEVAPNLIKNESFDNKLVPILTNSKEDNSMNIDNFYATFETDDGFDFEKLLISARQYIKNTKKI